MTQIIEAVKASWPIYTALLTIVTGTVAFAGVPARVAALEDRMDRQETVSRYVACVLKYQADGVDPRACQSHLSADLLEFLRPRAQP